MSVATYTKTGSKASSNATLPKEVFAVDVKNHELLKQAYEAYAAEARTNNATTLTRGNVRGGGRKPWRQKGTGRARTGSIRNPIWRGGGIMFGPTGNEQYTKKLNKKAKHTALRQALSLAAQDNRIIIIEDFTPKEGKTKAAAELLTKLEAKRSVLLIVDQKNDEVQRATNNLPNVKLITATYTSVFDVLNHDRIIVTKPALEALKSWLGEKS